MRRLTRREKFWLGFSCALVGIGLLFINPPIVFGIYAAIAVAALIGYGVATW